MTIKDKPIYRRSHFTVVPIVSRIEIRVGGRVLDTYGADELDQAIEDCDWLAGLPTDDGRVAVG